MKKVIYNDFAPLAAVNGTVPAQGSSAYQRGGDLLNEDKRDIINYASLEGRGIDLNDYSLALADSADNTGYISAVVSTKAAQLTNSRLVIDLGDKSYSAPGITLHFYKHVCKKVKITWYSGSNKLGSELTFEPATLDFFCGNPLSGFNRIVIDFLETQTSQQLVKLTGIDIGQTHVITEFYGGVNIVDEITVDCADLPGGECKFEAKITDFAPQQKQNFTVNFNDRCLGKYTVDKLTLKGVDKYEIEASNDVMQLGNTTTPALSQGSRTVANISAAIETASKISIDYGTLGETSLTGFIEQGKTARYAAAMLSFALGKHIIGMDGKKLKLVGFRDNGTIISGNRIFDLATYEQGDRYTAISLSTFSGSFNSTPTVLTAENPNVKSNDSTNVLTYDKFSLVSNASERFAELCAFGYSRNKVKAKIIVNDERIGDIVKIETPYNGLVRGVITLMDINIFGRAVADIEITELPEGGES